MSWVDELSKLVTAGNITIFNNSSQLIKARVDTVGADIPGHSESEFLIYPGSNEKWQRFRNEVVRICAYSLWHDFNLSPGAVVRFTPDFKLQILNTNPRNHFIWDARNDGPHIR